MRQIEPAQLSFSVHYDIVILTYLLAYFTKSKRSCFVHIEDVTDKNSAYSDERSLSVWHLVPIVEVFRLVLGDEGAQKANF